MTSRNGIALLVALVVASVLADFAYDKHGYFAFEHLPGFHGLFALAAGIVLGLVALGLRALLTRDANYYAPASTDAEEHPAADLEREKADA
ncbi:MAG: hypothetical protein Q7V31_15110 [Parvibaculum sp.]|uniref:hypothetical protein n=1 Tax=Parvibaculum sp. TaxID=2024848 RepID=UPI002726BF82|nr:hypothetical protein [Parvibaculum sp.]MDO8840244.1 hypothetical protein [Parvibaculum sp.]